MSRLTLAIILTILLSLAPAFALLGIYMRRLLSRRADDGDQIARDLADGSESPVFKRRN